MWLRSSPNPYPTVLSLNGAGEPPRFTGFQPVVSLCRWQSFLKYLQDPPSLPHQIVTHFPRHCVMKRTVNDIQSSLAKWLLCNRQLGCKLTEGASTLWELLHKSLLRCLCCVSEVSAYFFLFPFGTEMNLMSKEIAPTKGLIVVLLRWAAPWEVVLDSVLLRKTWLKPWLHLVKKTKHWANLKVELQSGL